MPCCVARPGWCRRAATRPCSREYRVLEALNGTDVPHPEAYAACSDDEVIGSSFYLMSLVDGWSPMNMDGWPAPFDTDLEARYGLGIQLVDGIARLARVDWRARGLEGFGKPEGFHDRQVDRWLAHLNAVQFRDLPGLDVAAEWLRTHKPSHWEPGIIHGDYQFANVMFCHGAPARLAAMVDWEMSTVGDPLLDLGWVMNGWTDPGEDRTKGYVDSTGMPSRAEMLDHYAAVSGRSVDEIDYYVILARFKLAIVLEAGYARVVAGEADNPEHGRLRARGARHHGRRRRAGVDHPAGPALGVGAGGRFSWCSRPDRSPAPRWRRPIRAGVRSARRSRCCARCRAACRSGRPDGPHAPRPRSSSSPGRRRCSSTRGWGGSAARPVRRLRRSTR